MNNIKDLNVFYMYLLHRIPDFPFETPKRSKRLIQNLMREYEYDDDYIENISEDFCQGFQVAKEIILTMCKEKRCEILKEMKS